MARKATRLSSVRRARAQRERPDWVPSADIALLEVQRVRKAHYRRHRQNVAFFIAVFSFVVYMIPGMFGAPLKALSGYLPPLETQDFVLSGHSGVNASSSVTLIKLPHGLSGYDNVEDALAVAKAAGKRVFVDIRPDTMNIDETKIEDAITDKTKVIIAMHYAGVACEMDTIMDIARRYNLVVVEDAAQGVMSTYKDRYLGTIGDFGCYSFHETKNYSMGEGGALLINAPEYVERAEIIREKGTDRSKFFRGQIDKYTWVDIGGSYLPSELNAAYLWGQLNSADEINENRLNTWHKYYDALKPLADEGKVELPYIPEECVHNAHMFYIKCKDLKERTEFISFMKAHGIYCSFHYIPLHSAPAGLKLGRFNGEDVYTSKDSDRLVRLPMYYDLKEEAADLVIKMIISFFDKQ